MKVVFIDLDDGVIGYLWLENLPPGARQSIPDAVTRAGRTFVLQPREAHPEALWNCEAVFKEALTVKTDNELYADRVDGMILSRIADLKWLVQQERSVRLVGGDAPDIIDRGQYCLDHPDLLRPHNAQALRDLKIALADARYWVHPNPKTANERFDARMID